MPAGKEILFLLLLLMHCMFGSNIPAVTASSADCHPIKNSVKAKRVSLQLLPESVNQWFNC